MKRLHHFDDRDIRAVVDELVICFSSVGPAPRVGEGMELRLTYLAARLAKEKFVIGVRVKGRIEIDKIDTRVRKFFPIGKPFQVIAKYNRFIDEMNSNPAVAGDSARNDNWVQRHAARRNTADSLDNNKSEQRACDKVIVALFAQQTPSLPAYRVGAFGDGAGMALMAKVALPRTTPRSGSHPAVNM